MHPNPKFKFHFKGIIKQIQQINIFILPILLFALSTPLFPFIPFTCLTDKVFNITKYQRLKIYIVVVVIVIKFVTSINTVDHIVTIFSVQYISDQIRHCSWVQNRTYLQSHTLSNSSYSRLQLEFNHSTFQFHTNYFDLKNGIVLYIKNVNFKMILAEPNVKHKWNRAQNTEQNKGKIQKQKAKQKTKERVSLRQMPRFVIKVNG